MLRKLKISLNNSRPQNPYPNDHSCAFSDSRHTWPSANRRFVPAFTYRLGLKRPAAPGHGAFDGNGDQVRRILPEGVVTENGQIGELSGFDGALEVLLERGVSAVHGADSNRFLHGDLLFWSPNVSFNVGAGHFRLQRHHGDEFSGRIVGSLRR